MTAQVLTDLERQVLEAHLGADVVAAMDAAHVFARRRALTEGMTEAEVAQELEQRFKHAEAVRAGLQTFRSTRARVELGAQAQGFPKAPRNSPELARLILRAEDVRVLLELAEVRRAWHRGDDAALARVWFRFAEASAPAAGAVVTQLRARRPRRARKVEALVSEGSAS